MSDKLTCQLLGNPEIRLNDELMLFSFSKIDALLYYLLVTKSASRDEMAGLFWPDKNDQNAKKNLRNAIYQANKMFGIEVIKSPNKALLTLSEELDIEVDIDLFMQHPREQLELYKESFLKGFFLKDCESFEFWVVKMRSFYEKIFLQECFKKIETDIETGHFDDVEKNVQRLINIDEFDETNYQLLMKFYQMSYRDEKVVETYYNLSNLLKIELGITPNKQSKQIYETSLERLNEEQNKGKQRFSGVFHGRFTELKEIETTINAFKNNLPYEHLQISGEAGIGKSTLVDVVLDHVADDFTIIETQCYQVEEKYAFRPWKTVISELSNLVKKEKIVEFETWQEVLTMFFPNLDDHLLKGKNDHLTEEIPLESLSEILSETLNLLGADKKIIVLFEDIQWMDTSSMDLLTSILLNVSSNVLFMSTSRNEQKNELEKFTNNLVKCQLLSEITLKPFTFEETESFIFKMLPDHKINQQGINNVFEHTEGNLFFLIEYISLLKSNANLNTMTVKMKDALKNRFLYLTEDEQTVVNLVSYFYDYVLFTDLVTILELPEIQLIDIVDSLVAKNILKELNVEGEMAVTFTHVKLRQFIYLNQSIAKKRIYHKKIAECLENSLTNGHTDYLIYDNLAFHYKMSRQELKSLTYKLIYLEKHLGFYHELFPVEVNRENKSMNSLLFNQENVLRDFESIRGIFNQLEETYKDDETYKELFCQFLYLEGRFLIKYGEYEKGVACIEKVINQSKELKNNTYLLPGYKQMIYYYIQIDEPEKMIHYIELALDLSIKQNNHQSIGVLLRLKGLNQMMNGNNLMAEKLLKESINTFMLTDSIAKKYAVNIAAAYNYLGEIRFNESRFEEAYDYFLEAINLCSNKKSLSSLSVFYTNAGAALFAQQKYELAEDFLLSSLAIYKELNTFWKRPRLDAYLALVYYYKNDSKQIKHFLDKGQEFAETMKNERDIGIVAFSKALVSYYLSQNESLLKEQDWSETLIKKGDEYAQEALMFLNDYQDDYEKSLIKGIF
ncbi:AAA family ATPase [Vagococcus fluvialis]|uniref:AAA family ATPase n=1 Tax=Vagococcus fluvialis TaxID=2738 RepID=UPI002034A6AC|nr:AAA family ATPase [Vagococcus fluvialis]MCM2140022.1 AAA family ATPase [Vagococcus fluvialis]